jgi:hypothetical protein
MTQYNVSVQEANDNRWAGRENSDGTVAVDMCLQCQIDRSGRQKHRS